MASDREIWRDYEAAVRELAATKGSHNKNQRVINVINLNLSIVFAVYLVIRIVPSISFQAAETMARVIVSWTTSYATLSAEVFLSIGCD